MLVFLLDLCFRQYSDHQPDTLVYAEVADRTEARCLWTTTDNGACHFRNLYYDTHTGRFSFFAQSPKGGNPMHTKSWQLPEYMASKVFHPVKQKEVNLAKVKYLKAERNLDGYGREPNKLLNSRCRMKGRFLLRLKWFNRHISGEVDEQFPTEVIVNVRNSFHRFCATCLACCRTYKPLSFQDSGLFMDWVDASSPRGSDVVEVSQPLIMRKTLKVNSFGHLLRDNLRALAELAGYFGVPTSSLQWIPEPHKEVRTRKSTPWESCGNTYFIFFMCHSVHRWPAEWICMQLFMCSVCKQELFLLSRPSCVVSCCRSSG